MKIAKRILIGLAVFIVLVLGLLVAGPILFKDRIITAVKGGINDAVTAEVDFADASVSFLRSFPEVTLTVEEFSVIGVDTFAGLPLVIGREARVDLGFWSVIAGGGNYRIDAVTLEEPNINLLVLTPELANYLIVAETEGGGDAGASSSSEGDFRVSLQEFTLRDGSLVYDDRTTGTYVKLTGLDGTGSGDFTASVFDVTTEATATGFTFAQAGFTYLDAVKLAAEATINVDADNFRYTFRENNVLLNELALTFDGSIDLEENDDILLDLTYRAPANDFRQLWSLIPSAFIEGYEQVQTTGTFTLAGDVKGTYNGETETYPAFTVESDITGGSVQYPGRPVGISSIDAALDVNSPGSDLDRMTVALPRLDFTLGGDAFRGMFRLATPLSDPDVDARLDGVIDLAKWAGAVPLEGVNELAGRIVADVTMNNVRQSAIDGGRYGDIDLAGDVLVSNLVYAAEGTPTVRIAQARAEFTPQFLDLQQFTASLGRSDLSASGRIDNLLAYFSPEQTMRGRMTVRSNFFDADEWMVDATDDQPLSPAEINTQVSAPTTAATASTEVFDRFDFDIDAEIQELAYGTYRPKDLKVVGNVKPNRLEIATASATVKSSTFGLSGVINNLFDYTFDDGLLTGDLSVRSGYFSLADFMDDTVAEVSVNGTSADTAPASAPTASAAIPVPRNINLRVDLSADRVQYTDLMLNAVSGQLLVRDGAVVIEDGRADLLGGSMGFTGSYDTAEGDAPGFHFSYDLRNLDFGQAFTSLNTFAILAPVGKFISGNFSSELVMEGKLGGDLFPQLSSIDARGLLRTAEARLATFKPLQAIGNALDVNELKSSTTLKNIIAAFEVEDGTVTVKPFDFSLAGIPMQIGGRHGLDLDMDYRVRAAVPRSMIQGNVVAGAALNTLDRLAGQASKLGFSIAPGDTLNLNIGLTGSIGAPKVALDLLGKDGGGDGGGSIADAMKDRLAEELDTRKLEVQQQVNAGVDSARRVAGTVTKAVEDSIRRVAEAQTEQLKQQAANQLKGALGMAKDSTRTDSLSLPSSPKEAVEDVRKELEKFNPFKRKKGGG